MTPRRAGTVAVLALLAAALGWVLFVGLPRWYGPAASVAPAATAPTTAAVRKIKARLFYVGESGTRLTSVEREVVYGEGTVEQAREIVTAQLEPATEPLVSAVPAGTRLRALFVTPQGQAFVDLTGEVRSAHPGGSTNERLTIYTIVDALTANLPAITAVQLLVDGKEVDTLAGHVDIRRPLVNNPAMVE